MKAPEYEVIQDFPGFTKGDIVTKMNDSDYYSLNAYQPSVTISHKVIKQCPKFFKLVEEKEFTKSDMESYVQWYFRQEGKHFTEDINVEAWKKSLK